MVQYNLKNHATIIKEQNTLTLLRELFPDNESMIQDLEEVARIKNKDINSILKEGIDRSISPYRERKHQRVIAKDGYWHSPTGDIECYILDETIMLNTRYKVIYIKNNKTDGYRKVPAHEVETA